MPIYNIPACVKERLLYYGLNEDGIECQGLITAQCIRQKRVHLPLPSTSQ